MPTEKKIDPCSSGSYINNSSCKCWQRMLGNHRPFTLPGLHVWRTAAVILLQYGTGPSIQIIWLAKIYSFFFLLICLGCFSFFIYCCICVFFFFFIIKVLLSFQKVQKWKGEYKTLDNKTKTKQVLYNIPLKRLNMLKKVQMRISNLVISLS